MLCGTISASRHMTVQGQALGIDPSEAAELSKKVQALVGACTIFWIDRIAAPSFSPIPISDD